MIKFKLNIKPKAERLPKAGDVLMYAIIDDPYCMKKHIIILNDIGPSDERDGRDVYCLGFYMDGSVGVTAEEIPVCYALARSVAVNESEIPERVKKVRDALFPDLVSEVVPYVPQRGDVYRHADSTFVVALVQLNNVLSFFSSDGENWDRLPYYFNELSDGKIKLIARSTNLPEYGWPETVEAEEV